jgi:hypothetical protein
MNSNEIVKSMNVDLTWITLAYILGRGEFTLIKPFAK